MELSIALSSIDSFSSLEFIFVPQNRQCLLSSGIFLSQFLQYILFPFICKYYIARANYQPSNLTAEAGHDRLLHNASVTAEPIPDLEFNQTLGWKSCAVGMAHAAERGLVWTRRWRRAASRVVCQIRIAGSVQFPPVTRIISLRTPNKSGLRPEVNGWLGLAQSGSYHSDLGDR